MENNEQMTNKINSEKTNKISSVQQFMEFLCTGEYTAYIKC